MGNAQSHPPLRQPALGHLARVLRRCACRRSNEIVRKQNTGTLRAMFRKKLDLPPEVARAFMRDMKAYFAEGDGDKRNVIAVRQLHALKDQRGMRDKKLGLSDVKAIFLQMKELA
jgi:hypothetical protein